MRRTVEAGCCARAASGQTAAPPSSVMKSRRFTASASRASGGEDSTALLHCAGFQFDLCLLIPTENSRCLPAAPRNDWLHCETDLQDLAVRVLRAGDHQADGCGAGFMAWNRQS